jgi:hypothetical protein
MNFTLRLNVQRYTAIIPFVGTFLILRDNPMILETAGFLSACFLAYLFSFHVLPRWIKI